MVADILIMKRDVREERWEVGGGKNVGLFVCLFVTIILGISANSDVCFRKEEGCPRQPGGTFSVFKFDGDLLFDFTSRSSCSC